MKIKKIGPNGIELIKKWEGCRLEAYIPVPGDVPTIGYGSTGKHVKMGDRITEERAEELLLEDLVRFEAGVSKYVTANIDQNQYDALVSFAFNLGVGALQKSTLLKMLNAGNHAAAALQFRRWNKAGGKVLQGLTNRRMAETALFNTRV